MSPDYLTLLGRCYGTPNEFTIEQRHRKVKERMNDSAARLLGEHHRSLRRGPAAAAGPGRLAREARPAAPWLRRLLGAAARRGQRGRRWCWRWCPRLGVRVAECHGLGRGHPELHAAQQRQRHRQRERQQWGHAEGPLGAQGLLPDGEPGFDQTEEQLSDDWAAGLVQEAQQEHERLERSVASVFHQIRREVNVFQSLVSWRCFDSGALFFLAEFPRGIIAQSLIEASVAYETM